MEKTVIGRIDVADLPAFNLTEVPVKIDSGAYTSSIHCDSIENIDGRLHVSFFDWKDVKAETVVFETFEVKSVKSSNGQPEERYIIDGVIRLFGRDYEAKFSLSTRQEMKYPVLLGRRLLNKNFVIDTSRTNLSWKNKTHE